MKIILAMPGGSLHLSDKALSLLRDKNLWRLADWYESDPHAFSKDERVRVDPGLIKVLEELGDKAFGEYGSFIVADFDIPEDVDWYIDEWMGEEFVRERHRIWAVENEWDGFTGGTDEDGETV